MYIYNHITKCNTIVTDISIHTSYMLVCPRSMNPMFPSTTVEKWKTTVMNNSFLPSKEYIVSIYSVGYIIYNKKIAHEKKELLFFTALAVIIF